MANNKKRAGAYKKSKIKTSGFLPGVFQTNLNKRWLDSTLDQMVSKSDLKHVEGYFGVRSGKYADGTDQYVMPPVNVFNRKKTQLSPAIVTRNSDNSVDNMITFDDVISAVNSNFSDYNYNAAYASSIYGYHPPIDSDKFINYKNYYWVERLPVYESYNETGSTYNPVTDSLGREIYTIQDDNNTFTVDNNMLIKFIGVNWPGEVQENTYVVTGVGDAIKMFKYSDADGKRYYTSSNKGDVKFAGYWDSSNYYTVDPNTNSSYWDSNKTPQELIELFNNDDSGNKLPLFDGFKFTNIGSNPSMFTPGVLIKFSNNWNIDELEQSKIYYTQHDNNTGEISIRTIIDAEYNGSGDISTFQGFITLPEDQEILDLLRGWDKDYWDSAANQIVLKDYHLIAKNDGNQTAWSRNNNWVNISTIHKLRDLIGDSFKVSDFVNDNRIAKRPIIEFSRNIALWNFGDENVFEDNWLGIVDFVLDSQDAEFNIEYNESLQRLFYTDNKFPVEEGNLIIFKNNNNLSDEYKYIFRLESDGKLEPVSIPLELGYTVFVNSAIQSSLYEWIESDAYFDGEQWQLGQQKTKANQPPLFKLYDYNNTPLENYNNSSFAGSKIFGYKIGTGAVDPELGLSLSYKDAVKGAEYEFENYILTKKYTESFTSSIDQKISHYQEIPGFYFFKVAGLLKHVYEKNELVAGVRQEYVYDYPNDIRLKPKSEEFLAGVDQTDFTVTVETLGGDWSVANVSVDGRDTREFSVIDQTVKIKNPKLDGGEKVVVELIDTSGNLIIPFGYDDWRFRKEILVHAFESKPRVTEIIGNGVYVEKTRNVIAGTNQTLTVHNLLPDTILDFKDPAGDNISSLPGFSVTLEPDGITYTIEIGDVGETVVNINTTPSLTAFDDVKIIVTDSLDSLYHSVYINGKMLNRDQYTVNNDSILVSKEMLEPGDLIDFEYYSNGPGRDENTGLPTTMDTNGNNDLMESFTLSETLSHWRSVVASQPGFSGDPFGYNNYSDIVKIPNIGGDIHIHADLSIMHDLSYSNKALDITGALIEQGAEWDGFIERFKNQVKRLYAVNSYESVFDIVSDALEAVTLNRKGSDLYRDSNMVYGHRHNQEILEIPSNKNDLYSKYVVNGDDNIRDHVYVYLTDDRDINGKFIKRLLTKDVDYFMVGNRIDLLITPNEHRDTEQRPFLTLSYHHMDEESFVPPSPVKLKLKNAYIPEVVGDILITHDGRQIELAPGAELEDVDSETFDPVNAAVFDLEKRIYAGLVSVDQLYGDRYEAVVNDYACAYCYFPANHRETWYTLDQINDYIEKFYQKWARERDIESLNTTGYYDVGDPFTWNYSSIEIGEHFTGNRLPGHWVGAYAVLFGTSTPHLTPWHMLGHTFKPTWWDEYYSWTDPTKRQRLLQSLKLGVVDRPRITNELRYQDSRYARYYWDWDNNCPVDESGNLVTPNQVFGTPLPVDAAKPFEFGDWGPVEQKWRSSAQGYMALVDAIVKLNPARAWTEFFQPGTIFKNRYVTDALNIFTKELPTVDQYPVPGEVYDSVIRSVSFENTLDRFPRSTTGIRIADGQGTLEAKTKISYQASGTYEESGERYSRISGISVISRGRGYISPPSVLTTFTTEENAASNFEIDLDQVPYVSCGISQAQYNYNLRRQYATDLNQIYSTLRTHLAQKLGGFSSKHLISLYVESGLQGAAKLSESDYVLDMYTGYPLEFVTASQLTVTKTETGYQVSGISSQRQEFEFYEPDVTNTSDTVSVGFGNVSVRKHKRFAGVPSVVQYGAKFNKIQDTYNFIRGYWHWMELSGYQLETNGDAQATRFVQWAVGADDDSSITFELGDTIKFTPVFGSVYEYNRYHYHRNDVLDQNGDVISNEDLVVDRLDGTVTVKTKNGDNIGSVATAVLLNEHIIILNDVSSFGYTLNDPARASRYSRLYTASQITDDWRGEKNALGYLVFDDRIVQNFDSSVSAVDDYYRTDVKEFNPALTKTKDLSIGNIDREWIANLGLSKNTITNFYQGAIKEAGTNGVIDKIARTSVLDHGTTTIDISEQYMFNQSYFGENKLENSIEVQLTQSDITSRPQVIKFTDLTTEEDQENIVAFPPGNKRIVYQYQDPIDSNLETPVITRFTFADTDFESSNLELLTAGEVLSTETDYTTLDMDTLPEIFDATADYATIPTWNSDTSYKFGDLVRYAGTAARPGLYQCNVNATGLFVVDQGIEATGTVTNPIFPNGTVVNIAGTTVTLENTATVYDNITAVGTTVSPTMDPTETLVINGVGVGFSKTTTATVVIGDAVLRGSISNPSIPDATGQTITINDVIIDFNEDTPADKTQTFTGSGDDVTPDDVVENIVAINGDQTYTISQTLSPTTYSVSSVKVDGVLYPSGDWSVTGQTITFATPDFAGGEDIEITLVHQPVYNNFNDTFTVTVETLGTLWSVSQVTVDGVVKTAGVDYNVVGQDIIFVTTNKPLNGQTIVATISHVPASFNLEEIVVKINSKNITNVSANISTDGFRRLEIRMSTTDPDAVLILGPSDTNALLGFSVDGRTARPPSEIQVLNDELTLLEIVEQINQASISGVIAGVLGSQIVLTSTNTYMTLSGSAVSILGLQTSYTAQESTIPTYTTIVKAIDDINDALEAAGVTTVAATIDNSRIKISSTENNLDLGDTEFNTIAGLPSGEQVSIIEEIENVFKPEEWININHADPALFSIWVADDSGYEVTEVEDIQTKYYSWNVFHTQNGSESGATEISKGQVMYTKSTDGTDCGICAGNATRDGNDAEVTTNVNHNLKVGDLVMLLNTTTTPNIDGIHRVTKLGAGANGDRIFYIDRFIEECGNAAAVIPLRTQRFQTVEDRDSANSLAYWNIPDDSLAWVNYDFIGPELTRMTSVYRKKVTSWDPERRTTRRPANTDIKNAVVYDTAINQSVAEFEVFDPIRGIIPGVADRELDFKTGFDPATYNTSTDSYYSTDDDDAWADKQVGQRWWNTSSARYYDYDQGSLSYRADNWGRQFAGSQIEVWEWTKSTVPPDEYAEEVSSDREVVMFGVVATGEAYSQFDPVADETLYYYTKTEEWDSSQGKYRDVYYFWVKDKTTIWDPTHMLPVKSVADIIDNPTANNIAWTAAIDRDAMIISNVNYYLTDDTTVLQVNKKDSGHTHNNWTLIAKDRDVIPEYWYIGVRNNLAGVIPATTNDGYLTDIKIPDFNLHPLNRYGDSRSPVDAKPNDNSYVRQAWFDNIRDARYNAVLIINELLQDVNIVDDLSYTWYNTILKTKENGELVLPRRMWQWADYITDDYNEYLQPTKNILSTLELLGIDTDLHQVAAMEIIEPDTELDRSELYYYIDGVWRLVRKNNATIEFDPLKLSLTHGWDTSPWDMISWDNTNISEYWRVIIDACRFDLFTGSRLHKFNQLFFAIVEYTLSKMQQTNWVHKSTYVSLYITKDIETERRTYKRDQLNEIVGYINTVKPFHTKISNTFDINQTTDEVSLHVEYSELKNITLDYSTKPEQKFVGTVIDSSELTRVLVYPVNGTRIYDIPKRDALLRENSWRVSEVRVGSTLLTESVDYVVFGQQITFEESPTEEVTINLVPWSEVVVSGGSFTDTEYDLEYNCGELLQPYNYINSGNIINEYQGVTVDLRPQELLNVVVQTNASGDTVDADTRTFVYIQDNNENVGVYGLPANSETTLADDFENTDNIVTLTDGSLFALHGFAYVGGEVVKFDRTGNILYIKQRGLNGTFVFNHASGSRIIDVTNTVLSTVTDKFGGQTRFNQPALSILNSTDAIMPSELAAAGQGIEL